MSAVVTHRIVHLWQTLQSATRGQKTELCDVVAADLGVSRQTIYRWLKDVEVGKKRKRRKDAGSSQLSYEDAKAISSVWIEGRRDNGKGLYTIDSAVELLRANKKICCETIDRKTGEVKPMSISAISRALYQYNLHPSQLLAPAPVTSLASLHPNHVWQIDASLCVLYYLKPQADPRMNGLQVMDEATFYKNKPKNFDRIAANRVWSYEITDHYTGWIYVEYVMGAESSENLCNVLINAMQERGGADVMHGVPRILMMDPGSANTSVMVKNLCNALGIRRIVHAPGAARVTGQVENARNIIERDLEAGLKMYPIADLAALNDLAAKWRGYFNFKYVHSRHGATRTELWRSIKPEMLIKAPSVNACRAVAVATPVSRKVSPKMTVSFEGREFLVTHVPNVIVGAKLEITRNPWRDDTVQVVLVNEEGAEFFFEAPVIRKNEAGFDIDNSAIIGEQFRSQPQTPAQKALKATSFLAMGVDTEDELKAARKQKRLPFNGELRPYQHIDDTWMPEFLPNRGTQHDLVVPVMETQPLNVIQVAKRLQPQFTDWSPAHLAWLKEHHPGGVKEEQLLAVADELRNATRPRPTLTVVGGI